jgi:autotransporter-associated beta strand protein
MRRFLALLSLGCGSLHAINIENYSPAKNNLFASGFLSDDPIRNANPQFVGAGYDWSAIGWITDAQSGRVTSFSLITPLHTLSATHNPITVLGSNARMVNSDGEVLDINLRGTSNSPVNGGDLNFAPLSRAVTSSEGIVPLRVLDISTSNYVGQNVFVVGSDEQSAGTQVATSRVQTASSALAGLATTSQSSSLSFQGWEGGDSGSPALIPYEGKLTMAGTAWYAAGISSLLPGTTYNPVNQINSYLFWTGYALKWTIYDNPADAANTANVWTGNGGSGAIGDAANWQYSSSISNRPVVFDSSSSAQAAVQLPTNASLRGILFRNSAGSDGFSFSGTGTLTLGATGIRNEASGTQIFDVPIQLGGSQNWEAENGNLEFNGRINTAGYLLAIGGARDTTIRGVISGSGGLAKDGAGTLTLTAANTYTGPTFLHDGTLRLEGSGNLPSTALMFIAGNPAVLDLNGRNQTLGEVSSSFGGKGRILLGGATLTVNASGDGSTSYLGSIEGAGSVIKSGAGVWTLSGTNSYSGATRLNAGVLRLASTEALPFQSNLIFNGGVLELGSEDFTRALGTGAGQVQFTGFGGFSAHGGTRIVNLGGNGATVTWGNGGFVPTNTAFRLSSTTSNGTVEFRNHINLAGGWQTFSVANGSAAIDGRITGIISNGGLIKSNGGILELTATNTYSGPTQIWEGAILATAIGALGTGNLQFSNSGGILILGAEDFTRSLGTGAGQVQFTSAGGFAAYGANRVVNLGNNGSIVTWGQGGFVPSGQSFLLSAEGAATATVEFRNAIDLAGASRTFQVANGSAAVDAVLSGSISNGGVIKSGEGTLRFSAVNTYTGQTQINAGTLIASDTTLGSGNLILNGGVLAAEGGAFSRSLGSGAGQVQFAGSGGFAAFGTNLRVNLGGNGATVIWGSGGFVPTGSSLDLSSASADATVTFVNPIDFSGTSRTINVNDGRAAVDARLEGIVSNGGLTKTGAGTLEFVAANNYSGATRIADGALRISSATALSGSSNLVLAGGVIELAAGNFSRSLGIGANQVQFASSGGFSAVGADRAVNLGGAKSAVTWDGAARFLSYNQKLILSSESANATVDFQNPIVLGTSSIGQRTIEVRNGSAAIDGKISGTISSPGAGIGIQKVGAGTLELSAVNSYAGITTVSEGTLIVSGGLSSTSRIEIEKNGTFLYSGAAGLSRQVLVEGGSFIYNSSALFSGSLKFESGYLGGNGNLGGTSVNVSSGLTISPGASAGTLRTGSQEWGNGGVYLWEIASLSGTAGTSTGWDLLSIQGSLTISADTGAFAIRLSSFGELAGWDPSVSQSWVIATSTGQIQGFNPGLVTVDSAGFSAHNNLAGGSFAVGQNGQSIQLVFIAVPEPSTTALLSFAFVALLKRKRRR